MYFIQQEQNQTIKKVEEEVEINTRAPTGLAISDAALGRQIVQDPKRSRTGRLPFFLFNRSSDGPALHTIPRRHFWASSTGTGTPR